VRQGVDLTAIAGVWPRSPIGIFSLKEHNITKPKDLEGQTIGFVTGGGEIQLWPAFVKATGIDASKVKIISMDPAGLMRAAADKQIKVAGNFFGSIAPTFWAKKIDIDAVFYEDYGVKMYSVVLAAKRSTLEKEEMVAGVVEGLMEGLKYAYLNPKRAIDLHIESLREFQGRQPDNARGSVVRAGGRRLARLQLPRSGTTAWDKWTPISSLAAAEGQHRGDGGASPGGWPHRWFLGQCDGGRDRRAPRSRHPFYSASIAPHAVASLNRFAREVGLLKGDGACADIVAAWVVAPPRGRPAWHRFERECWRAPRPRKVGLPLSLIRCGEESLSNCEVAPPARDRPCPSVRP
jgi:hypothetical protein